MKKMFTIILSFKFIIILCAVISLDICGSSSNFTRQPRIQNGD